MPKLDIRIMSLQPPGSQGGVRAYASMTIDGCFGVRGIRVVEGGKNGLFVSMPSRKMENNTYKDICYPVTAEFRQQIQEEVLAAYHQTAAMMQAPAKPQEALRSGVNETQKSGRQMAGM